MPSMAAHLASQQRLHGPILSGLTANSLFAGDDANARMKDIRGNITKVRSIWQKADEYNSLVQNLLEHIYNDKQSVQLKEQIRTLLATYHDWADFQPERPAGTNLQPWAFIELYTSNEGYNYLFGLFNEILRMPDADRDKLLAAAFLTEILTIELYNLRLSNIGDPMYANFQGIVFRGLSVNSDTVVHFQKAANHHDLTKRCFSIPLGFLSSTTARSTMEDFSKRDLHKKQMHWIIHIHGLDPGLLRRYEDRYPESVVTSICAMPIARIAEHGEREILLRGAFFHIIGMRPKTEDSHEIQTVEMVMLNTNRDHATEHALHVGEKLVQREYFNDIILASRYNICASLAKAYSSKDSESYEKLKRDMLRAIEVREATMKIPEGKQKATIPDESLANSWPESMATWIGDSIGRSFPQHYLSKRKLFHEAASQGNWAFVQYVLEREYDLRQADWFNVGGLSDGTKAGRTLLHEISSHGPPPEHDLKNCEGWKYVLKILAKCEAWHTLEGTLRTFGSIRESAEDIARSHKHDDLIPILKPKIYRQISKDIQAALQKQLHELMNEHAKQYLDGLAFRIPELSVLTEIKKPELWIPIPGMYGGFLITLQEQTLRVTLHRTIDGKVKSQRQEFRLGTGYLKAE